jgi:DNA topoisomerase-6 subunit B
VKITSRTGAKTKAHLYELQIDTKKNAPIVLDDGPGGMGASARHADRHGASRPFIRRASARWTSISTRWALPIRTPTFHFIAPQIRPRALHAAIGPTPATVGTHSSAPRTEVELGVLIEMMQTSSARNVASFLSNEFSRMSARRRKRCFAIAKVPARTKPASVTRDQAEAIIKAFPQ